MVKISDTWWRKFVLTPPLLLPSNEVARPRMSEPPALLSLPPPVPLLLCGQNGKTQRRNKMQVFILHTYIHCSLLANGAIKLIV
jgi:hypothetical protein